VLFVIEVSREVNPLAEISVSSISGIMLLRAAIFGEIALIRVFPLS
jgi:hypothetical protein